MKIDFERLAHKVARQHLTGTDNRIEMQRKDTGRTVLVSPETVREHPEEYVKKEEGAESHEVSADTIMKSINRPKGWRSWEDAPELSSSNVKEWLSEHRVQTAKGSVLLGTPHVDGSNLEGDTIEAKVLSEHIIPGAIKVAEKALAQGKKVVFLSEGQSWGTELGQDTVNEQHMVAKALHDKFGEKVTQDTWDDSDVDVWNPKAPIWVALTKAAGGNKALAHASIAVADIGQGVSPKESRNGGILSPEAGKLIQERLGIDLTKKLKSKDQDRLYRAAFPEDFGDPPNEISALTHVFNAYRQGHMLRKIMRIESQGGVAIVTPGASHAYALKPAMARKR